MGQTSDPVLDWAGDYEASVGSSALFVGDSQPINDQTYRSDSHFALGCPYSHSADSPPCRHAPLHAIHTIGHGERQAMALSTDDLKWAIRTELNIAVAAVRTHDQALGRVRDLERENDALRGRLRCLEESLLS